jgi:hypothetical protein
MKSDRRQQRQQQQRRQQEQRRQRRKGQTDNIIRQQHISDLIKN